MELKEFQRRVVDEVERYLKAIARERAAGNRKHAGKDAWESLGLGRYEERRNGLGEDLPEFCIKVPTGGGKTLLATQILGSIYRTLLRDRNGAGLALWMVPSSQIYKDTLRRLRDRTDLYRLMLEHALSRRIEVWEKHEVTRLSPAVLRECLNILVIQLASTNRATRERLKFFRDSGGLIIGHFPPESNPAAHKSLKARIPNLDMIEDDESSGRHLVATSVGNLVRLCAPPVILDEGHKATSRLARETIQGFNASVVVELSATPQREANVVSRVSGEELLREEMIKLPMNIATSGLKSWKDVLTRARDRREVLAWRAAELESELGPPRHIRPIVLVQVERTGKEQRGKGFLHGADVEEFLVQNLAIPAKAIAVKTAEDDGLEDLNLLDPGCPVEWIITRSALQEGWDCPFAYVLVSLQKTGSSRAMTQLVGRVLRQPYQRRTSHAALNESYIYCLHHTAGEIASRVKLALEKEGYEGDAEGLVSDATRTPERTERRTSIKGSLAVRHARPFAGKIYRPRFCVEEDGSYEALDYFQHLFRHVDSSRFDYEGIDWSFADALRDAGDRFYKLTLKSDLLREDEEEAASTENDEQALAWMASNFRFDYLSHKEIGRILRRVHERLLRREPALAGKLSLVKFLVRDQTEAFVREGIDRQAERVFGELLTAGRIKFYLECAERRVEVPESIVHDEHERAIALCLDRHADVLWWFRNRVVGQDQFTVQGYRRGKVHSDSPVQGRPDERRASHEVLVVDRKRRRLEDNPDAACKRQLARSFENAGRRVTWHELGTDFKDHVFRFQVLDETGLDGRDRRDALSELLDG